MRLSGTVYSNTLEMDTPISLVTPNNLTKDTPYHVAYVLHGLRGNASSWLDYRFEERIPKLLVNVSISLAALDENGKIVGALLGLTDFAYWLYVTDLGVDREYTRRGIGRALMKTAHEIAGGEKDIAVYLIANENAVPFYKSLGMKFSDDVMQYNHIEWTEFTVE